MAAKKKAAPRAPVIRAARAYPRRSLQEALQVAQVIKQFNGGNPWSPSEVATAMELAPKSSTFYYITAAARDFGLTVGTRETETISLSDFGRSLVYAPNQQQEEQLTKQAFLNVEIFRRVLEHYKGTSLPDMKYVSNTLEKEFGLAPELHEEFIALFRENARVAGIGAGFVATKQLPPPGGESHGGRPEIVTVDGPEDSDSADALHCFVVMPFRERTSAYPGGFFDEVLRSVIAPAGKKSGFVVTTANRDGSDVIQSTIINNLLDADLVIADLTEHNPNVLFELGMRMAFDKPVVLIRARGTGQIFDVDNMLRVFEYDPNLWPSTVQTDVPSLTTFVKATWSNRGKENTYMRILRRPPAAFSGEGAVATAA